MSSSIFRVKGAILRRFFAPAASLLLLGISASRCTPALKAEAPPDEPALNDTVGAIQGESIAVTGPMSVEAAGGQVKTVLRSGSNVHVKSGKARIDLIEGGQITICGPAHFSVLKADKTLTVALDTGTIHIRIDHEPAITVYTAQLKVQPVAIGDGPQDILVGFDTPGAMCVRTPRGAARLEQQLTGQSILVPQNGDVVISNGQIDKLLNGGGRCGCEMEISRGTAPSAPPGPPSPMEEISQMATSEEIRKRIYDAKPNPAPMPTEKPSASQEPIYQVIVPPLIYDAKARVQPEIDPRLIVLVRKARVRPTLIFQGRVEGDEVTTAALVPPAPAAANAKPPAPKPANPPSNSLVDRVKNYWRKLWSSSS